MKPLDLLLQLLETEMQSVENSITRSKKIRDLAPSAAESHSDTTRSEYEKLVHALEDKQIRLKSDISVVRKALSAQPVPPLWTVVSYQDKKFLLVPDGFGGRQVGDMFLLSVTIPLGRQLSAD